MVAGLLDAGLEQVDWLEEYGGEGAGAEASYEVECLMRGEEEAMVSYAIMLGGGRGSGRRERRVMVGWVRLARTNSTWTEPWAGHRCSFRSLDPEGHRIFWNFVGSRLARLEDSKTGDDAAFLMKGVVWTSTLG